MDIDFSNLGKYFVDMTSTGLLISFIMKMLTSNFAFLATAHRFLKLAVVLGLGVAVTFLGHLLGYTSGDIQQLFVYGLLSGITAAGLYDSALRPITDLLVRILQNTLAKK